jgi:tetratricopeptide (TPR) repeat protein
MGTIAQEQRDFAAAEQWYRKSLAITEKQGNEYGAAITYHQLGIVAEEQRDFAAAEQWYRKSLAITEKQGNKHGAAGTYGQLGRLAGIREDFLGSGGWLIKSVLAFLGVDDARSAAGNAVNFSIFYKKAPPAEQSKLKAMWEEAGLGPFPWEAA